MGNLRKVSKKRMALGYLPKAIPFFVVPAFAAEMPAIE
jgi:hypothetical protein